MCGNIIYKWQYKKIPIWWFEDRHKLGEKMTLNTRSITRFDDLNNSKQIISNPKTAKTKGSDKNVGRSSIADPRHKKYQRNLNS